MSVIELLASSPALFVGTCLVLGLAVGSFLNVVIYRLPVMLDRAWRAQCAESYGDAGGATLPTGLPQPFNLVVPRSACPACRAPISAWHNIPLLSWVLLRGRCASCGEPISVRYPLIEALSGILCAAVAWRFGFGWPALAALVLTWFLIALTFIDVDHQLLPDNLTLPLLWLGLLLALWGPQPGGAALPVDLRSSVLGALAGYLSLWSVYHLFRLLTGKEGMGYGDFKLFAALGAWLGWQMLLPIIVMAATVGAVVGIALITLRGRNRASPIAFGPFLAAAGWLMLMFGPQLLGTYLGLFAARP
jgi:leader peptidase (prepilin peptidase) / N-methyltransferase